MGEFIDLLGKRFGRLVVIGTVSRGGAYVKWRCRCDCGAEAIVRSQNLRVGQTKSCGCLKVDVQRMRITAANFKHGETMRKRRSPTYVTWMNMLQRCHNPNNDAHSRYGGRGISVCERWQNFENFLADMGEQPFPGAQIDRKDNDGNYEPWNCRWASRLTQANNTRANLVIEFRGSTRTLMEWSRLLGIPRKTISNRLSRGWTVERALFTKQGLGSNQHTSKSSS